MCACGDVVVWEVPQVVEGADFAGWPGLSSANSTKGMLHLLLSSLSCLLRFYQITSLLFSLFLHRDNWSHGNSISTKHPSLMSINYLQGDSPLGLVSLAAPVVN